MQQGCSWQRETCLCCLGCWWRAYWAFCGTTRSCPRNGMEKQWLQGLVQGRTACPAFLSLSSLCPPPPRVFLLMWISAQIASLSFGGLTVSVAVMVVWGCCAFSAGKVLVFLASCWGLWSPVFSGSSASSSISGFVPPWSGGGTLSPRKAFLDRIKRVHSCCIGGELRTQTPKPKQYSPNSDLVQCICTALLARPTPVWSLFASGQHARYLRCQYTSSAALCAQQHFSGYCSSLYN